MLEEKIYTALKKMEFSAVKDTILEKSFEKRVDYILESIISCYGLQKIRNKLNNMEKYYFKAILNDEEFWDDIDSRFQYTREYISTKEEKEMGIYKSWLVNVEAGLSEKWVKDETKTKEEVHSLAIAGCCLWIGILEDRWSKGTISKEHNSWLEKVTNDNDYWTDWEVWKKSMKDLDESKIGMSKDEFNIMKKRIEEMAEQKAETETTTLTTVTACERDDTNTMKTCSQTYSSSSTTGTSTSTSWVSSYNKPPVGFSYHGRKNKTILPDFITICKMTQKTLKKYLIKKLKGYYDKENICARDGFIFVKGEIPVMVTAHMDTVHTKVIEDFYEWTEEQEDKTKGLKYDVHVLSSPQGIGGDDRCGIWMILQMLELGYRPFIIFNEDEEIGCVGATKFCKKGNADLHEMCKEIKFIIELDRRGKHDLVFYSCANDDFSDWCEKVTNWKEDYGSCSDISYLAPELGCAAVNLSCGYYDEHKLWHTVKIEEMFNTLSTAIKMIDASETVERFEYVESYNYWGGYNNKSRYYDYDYDDYDDYDCDFSNASDKYGTCIVDFEFYVYNGGINDWELDRCTVRAWKFAECYEKFFRNHPNTCFADIVKYTEYNDYSHSTYNTRNTRNSYYY